MQTLEITHGNLPEALTLINNKVDTLLQLLGSKSNDEDRWFNLDELCQYLPDKPAKATIYAKVSNRSIPSHKGKGQKMLRFKKSEIDSWLSEGQTLTKSQIRASSSTFLK